MLLLTVDASASDTSIRRYDRATAERSTYRFARGLTLRVGGNDDDDSGTLSYVSHRCGGRVVGLTNELNGLSVGGIGRDVDGAHSFPWWTLSWLFLESATLKSNTLTYELSYSQACAEPSLLFDNPPSSRRTIGIVNTFSFVCKAKSSCRHRTEPA